MLRYTLIFVLVVVAAGLVFIYSTYREDMRVAYGWVESLRNKIMKTSCGTIQYAIRGEGYPVIVVHGISGGFDQGLDLAVFGNGFKVIAPSRFGYLETPLPENATPATQADAFACLLDELGIDRAAIVAYSAGGTSAIQFALRYPERTSALLLVSSTAPSDELPALPPEPVIKSVFGSDFIFWLMTTHFRNLMKGMIGVPRGYRLTPQDEQLVADRMQAILPVKPRQQGVAFDMFVSNLDMIDNRDAYPLEKISVPTLVINAVDDPLASYQDGKRMSKRIPDATFVSIPQGGHLLLGAEEMVEAEMTQFLQAAFER